MRKTHYVTATTLLLVMLGAVSLTPVRGQEVIPEEQTFYMTKPTTERGIQLNPLAPFHQGMENLCYERLGMSDDVSILYGVTDIRPVLAESWRWVDDTTFEIKIRRIAHFRSGRTVTADDVLFSLELEMRTDIGGPLAYMQEYIESIEKIDDYTINVNMKPQYARNKMVYWILVDSFVVPEYKWAPLLEEYGTGIIDYIETDFDAVDGSGPYTPIALPESAIAFRRVEEYWGEQLGWLFAPEYWYYSGDHSSDIMFRLIGEHKRDLCSLSAEMSVEWQRERSAYLGGWNFFGEPYEMHGTETWVKGVSLNFERVPIFKERWLREAMTYCVNYKKIAEAALYRQALPGNHLSLYAMAYPDYVMMTKEVLEENFEHVVVDGGIPRLAFDPELAIEILTEHCDEGSSVETGWYYNGEKVGGWKMNTVSGWSSWMTAAEVLCKEWNDIGLDIEYNPIEWGTFYDITRRGDFDLTYNWIGEGDPPVMIERALDQVYLYAGVAGIPWAGDSSTGFQVYWNGSYPPLPDVAGEVKDLIGDLWVQVEGSEEYIATFKRLCELVLPELAWIPTVQDGSMKLWNRADRWVNWPTVDDPYEYRIHDTGVDDLNWHIVKHVYPAKVETVDFTLPSDSVEVGETFTATVTLNNKGEDDQRYKVAVNIGPAEPGWELTEEGLLAWQIVKVPPGEMTVTLPITIEEPGTYILVVDNWRIGEFDPGVPLEKALSVTEPLVAGLLPIVEATRDAVSRVESSVSTLGNTVDTLSTTVSELSTTVSELSGVVAGSSSLLYATIGLQVIVLVIVALVAAKAFKK